MDPTKEPERRAVRRFADLCEARGLGRGVLARSIHVADNAVTERFGGRTRTKLGDLLVMVEAMGGDREEDLVGIAGGFHPEIYLRDLCKRDERQERYARSDVVLPPPKRPYSPLQLARVAAGLQELQLLDLRKAHRRSLRALRTLRYYPERGGRETNLDVHLAMAGIWCSKGNYSASGASLSKAFRLAGQNRNLRARAYLGLAHLARDVGDLSVGLEAARRAGRESLEALDLSGLGRSLITQGTLYIYSGQDDAALACWQASVPMVEDDAWFWRYYGFHNLALCQAQRGELEEALARASDARALLDATSERAPLLMSLALWLRGEIRLRIGRAEDSARDLEEVLGIYLANGFRPIDVACIGIRLAEVYSFIGNTNGSAELIRRLRPMAARGGANDKLTEAAFAELARQGEQVAQWHDNADPSGGFEIGLRCLAS